MSDSNSSNAQAEHEVVGEKLSSNDAVNSVKSSDQKTKNKPRKVKASDADATLKFQEQYDAEVPEITPEQEKRLARKVVLFIVTFVCLVDLLLYMDKATLSYASIFEFWDDTGLDQNKYNNINTIFYVGYIVGQIPGNYLLQKLPVGRFLFILTFLWTVIIFLHCAAYNYAGVIVLRFFLGFVESVCIPLLNITMGQFLTQKEKAACAPIFYSTCLGVTIPTGFIAYGVLYSNSTIHDWRIFMIIIGGLTFFLSIAVLFLYPNNPATAKFLTIEERIWVIRRVQTTTGAAIEQKVFKKYQFIEAFKDPITWLFGLFFLLQQLANNLPYQQNLLFTGMGGVSNLDSTLVSVASGGFAGVSCFIASYILLKFQNISAFSVVFWSLPSFVGSIVAATLPWDNKIGLLAALCLSSPIFGIPWIIMFSWTSTTCSGYTKKITRNGFIMFWYGIANIISPQLWQSKDAPRYIPAWCVQIVLSFFIAPLTSIIIWYILRRRNIERLANLGQDDKVGIIEESDHEVVVNIASLDLTDWENKTFIYPL